MKNNAISPKTSDMAAYNLPRPKILIIRLSSIGDIVQCSALPRHLRRAFPTAVIDWVVRSDNQELVKFNSQLNETFAFNREEGLTGWLVFSKKLATEGGYTHVYDAHNNLRSFILTSYLRFARPRSLPPLKFIRRSKKRWQRFLLFWFKINLFAKNYSAVESYVNPLKPWGISYDQKGGELHLPAESTAKVKSRLDDFESRQQTEMGKGPKLEGPPVNPVDTQGGGARHAATAQAPPHALASRWIAVAPATAWPKKTWPLEYWKSLVQTLLEKTQASIAVLGGPSDAFCGELVLDPKRVLNLQGQLTLLESAAVTPLCTTLIAADTGLLHMGEAMGQNVIGILGPTPFGHPARSTSIGLQEKLWCQPCSKDGSGPCINLTYQKCLKLVTPAQVFGAVQQLMIAQRPMPQLPKNGERVKS